MRIEGSQLTGAVIPCIADQPAVKTYDPLEVILADNAGHRNRALVNGNDLAKSYIPLDNLMALGLELNAADVPWFVAMKCRITELGTFTACGSMVARHLCYIASVPTAYPAELAPWIFFGYNVDAPWAFTCSKDSGAPRYGGTGGDGGAPDGGEYVGLLNQAGGTGEWPVGYNFTIKLQWTPGVGLKFGAVMYNGDTFVNYRQAEITTAAAKAAARCGSIPGQFVCLDEFGSEGVTCDGFHVGHSNAEFLQFVIGNGDGDTALPGDWWIPSASNALLVPEAGRSMFAWDFQGGNLIGEQFSE